MKADALPLPERMPLGRVMLAHAGNDEALLVALSRYRLLCQNADRLATAHQMAVIRRLRARGRSARELAALTGESERIWRRRFAEIAERAARRRESAARTARRRALAA